MSLVVVGINHKTAPLEIREKIHFPKDDKKPFQTLKNLKTVDEGLILSTCNRVEVYAATQDTATACQNLSSFIAEYHGYHPHELSPYVYTFHENEAIHHTFRVTSSLDSMVIGEAQILGQVKEAYRLSQEAQTVGPLLHRVYQKAFSVAKRVRTETAIGSQPVSIGSVAVQLCHKIFDRLDNKTILLMGAGEMMETIAELLWKRGVKKFYVANRTQKENFFKNIETQYLSLESFPGHLHEMDMILVSTGSPTYLITRSMMQIAIDHRKQEPMFCVDISVPRNIDPKVHGIENVYLYNIDDLQSIIKENYRSREEEAQKAEVIVKEEVQKFLKKLT